MNLWGTSNMSITSSKTEKQKQVLDEFNRFFTHSGDKPEYAKFYEQMVVEDAEKIIKTRKQNKLRQEGLSKH